MVALVVVVEAAGRVREVSGRSLSESFFWVSVMCNV